MIIVVMEMVWRVDAGRINFESKENEGAFHVLLAICLTIVFDGKVPVQKMK